MNYPDPSPASSPSSEEDNVENDPDYFDGEDEENYQSWVQRQFAHPPLYSFPRSHGQEHVLRVGDPDDGLDRRTYVYEPTDDYQFVDKPIQEDEAEIPEKLFDYTILADGITHQKAAYQGAPEMPPRKLGRFEYPTFEDSDFIIPGVDDPEVPEPFIVAQSQLLKNDREFYNLLSGSLSFVNIILTSSKAFDDAIIQIEIVFNRVLLRDDLLFNRAEDICRLIGSLVYRYVYKFFYLNAGLRSRREFKVQLSFSAIFKKLRKDFLSPIGAPAIVGNYEYLTFYKEAMCPDSEGKVVHFKTPQTGFQCAYNTASVLINQCLDARNVPNMDSSWRYDSLKAATIKLFCYESVVSSGHGYMPIPKHIASKKACINPKCDQSCFWWSVKLALILNREARIDYSKSAETLKKEVHEVSKVHTRYQIPMNILKACNSMGIGHYWERMKGEGEESRFPVNPGVEEIIAVHQGDLPDNVPLEDKYFKKFCNMNPGIMLSVFAENPTPNSSIPIQLVFEGNNSIANEQVRVLYLGTRDEEGHYVCIKNFNRFLSNIDKCKGRRKVWCEQCKSYRLASSKPCKHLRMKEQIEGADVFCCEKCMGSFQSADELTMHNHMCLIVDKNYRVIELPDERKYLEFDNKKSNNLTPLPTYMVADFESVLIPTEDEENDGVSKSRVTAKHLPCAYGLKVVSQYPELEQFETFWGKDAEDTMSRFCNRILEISHKVYEVYSRKRPMIFTEYDRDVFNTSEECYICHKKFNSEKDKYRDHDHASGKFLGAACNGCNFRRVLKNCDLPLIFHNAKGYDLHHIIKEITKRKYGCSFNGIAQNSEKIMSFTIMKFAVNDGVAVSWKKEMCNIKIIDSLLFLLKSLESLTNVLKKKHPGELDKSFPYLYKEFRREGYKDTQIEAALNKNIYPYLWFDSFDKIELPFSELVALVNERKYECFTDNVDDEYKKNFEKKAEVFNNLLVQLPFFKDVRSYADLYLKCDVLELTDIIESARQTMFKTHRLDMLRYYGAPGYSWEAFLYHRSQKSVLNPHLFISTEMNMVCFFMQCIRGGCSGIMKRYCRANNYLIPRDYDPTKPQKYILYVDANNLYGWSMSQTLPYRNFTWFSESEIKGFNDGGLEFITTYFNSLRTKVKGCFLEVKLLYPKELHDAHNSYPLAPERRCIKESELSYFTRELHSKLHTKINTKTPLLLQTLEDKDHYFVYWKNLELYLELGLVLEHVYGGIYFDEAPVMKSYIELNTELRNQPGASDFERELYKLMNNSIYGKTLENPLKYSILQMVSTRKQFDKAVAKPGFDGCVFMKDDFAIVKLKYETVKYDKPLYLGATITELAKWKMYDFLYRKVRKILPSAQVVFTDTDSFILEIETQEDIYEVIARMNSIPEFDCPIDISTFDKDICWKYKIPYRNNKVIGAFKSETGSEQIVEFVGLRAKMYSYIVNGDETNKHFKAKGVARSSLNMLTHKNYRDCLFNPDIVGLGQQSIEMKTIQSKKHELRSVTSTKISLSGNDTKRYIIPTGEGRNIETLAFGHYLIPKYEGTNPNTPTPTESPSHSTPEKDKTPESTTPLSSIPLQKKRGRPIKYKV